MGITDSIDISTEQRQILLDLFSQHLPNTKVWAFGSRVKWTTRFNSDLDLVVFSSPEQNSHVSALKEGLEESSLPFRVDLLVWDKIPESFKRNIEEGYVVLVGGKDSALDFVMSSDYRVLWESAGGRVPEHWQFICFEELLESPKSISVGVMYPGENTEGGIPLIKVSDVKSGYVSSIPKSSISLKVDNEYKRTRLNGTELLITLVGNPGDCVIATEEMAGWNTARAIAVVRLKDITLRPWIRYVLLSSPAKHLIQARLNTTVQKTLNLKDIKELALPMPSKQEREQITNIIDSIEKKVIINIQTNQTLEQIAQALFKSWFVDFDPVKAKIAAKQAGANAEQIEQAALCAISGKTPEQLAQLNPQILQQLKTTAALFPDALVDSELGEIPEGWEVQKIEDVIDLAYGKALNKTVRVDGEFPVYGSGGLTGIHNQFLVDGPGVIVGRKGNVGSLFWEDKSFYPIDTVFYVRCKKDMTLEFSYYLLQIMGLENMNTDAAVPGLNRNNVYRLELPKYPKPLVDGYTKIISNIRKKIRLVNNEIITLETIRDSLLPKLLSGEISLSNLNEVA